MEQLNRLIIDNAGLVFGFFCLFLTALSIIVPAITNRKSKEVSAQLKTKDATIENLQMQLLHANTKLAEMDGYEKRASDEQEQSNGIIQGLHKRISELEAAQFIEVDRRGHATLKSSVFLPDMDG